MVKRFKGTTVIGLFNALKKSKKGIATSEYKGYKFTTRAVKIRKK